MHTDYIMNQEEFIIASMVSAKTPQGVIGMPLTCEALKFNIMKEIKLTQGKVALVDDENFEYLNQFKWYANKGRYTYYAERMNRIMNRRIKIKMHRIIMKSLDNMQVDHIDHNGLNCQKYNMRNCTPSENSSNRYSKGKSKYNGVTVLSTGKSSGRITARIMINKKRIFLGHFKTEEEAAISYDNAIKKYNLKYHNLNFK